MDTFVVSLHLMIDSRQPSKGTSKRGWIVVVHYSILAEYRGVIGEAFEGVAQDCPAPERSHFIYTCKNTAHCS